MSGYPPNHMPEAYPYPSQDKATSGYPPMPQSGYPPMPQSQPGYPPVSRSDSQYSQASSNSGYPPQSHGGYGDQIPQAYPPSSYDNSSRQSSYDIPGRQSSYDQSIPPNPQQQHQQQYGIHPPSPLTSEPSQYNNPSRQSSFDQPAPTQPQPTTAYQEASKGGEKDYPQPQGGDRTDPKDPEFWKHAYPAPTSNTPPVGAPPPYMNQPSSQPLHGYGSSPHQQQSPYALPSQPPLGSNEKVGFNTQSYQSTQQYAHPSQPPYGNEKMGGQASSYQSPITQEINSKYGHPSQPPPPQQQMYAPPGQAPPGQAPLYAQQQMYQSPPPPPQAAAAHASSSSKSSGKDWMKVAGGVAAGGIALMGAKKLFSDKPKHHKRY
ncbi:hypothetical protein BGZ76_001566 [Entomortierella beljakovae]|nr:hypothetical protein BGZ76_001566 [Entomortierella beljakovae]